MPHRSVDGSYSQGTGGSGKDQVIFETAPAAGAALTADYTHESGGAEEQVRSMRERHSSLTFASPKVPPHPAPSPTDRRAEHCVGACDSSGSWNGGAPTSINNAIKTLLHADGSVDPAYKIPRRSGRSITLPRRPRDTTFARSRPAPTLAGGVASRKQRHRRNHADMGTIEGNRSTRQKMSPFGFRLQLRRKRIRRCDGLVVRVRHKTLTPYPGVAPCWMSLKSLKQST